MCVDNSTSLKYSSNDALIMIHYGRHLPRNDIPYESIAFAVCKQRISLDVVILVNERRTCDKPGMIDKASSSFPFPSLFSFLILPCITFTVFCFILLYLHFPCIVVEKPYTCPIFSNKRFLFLSLIVYYFSFFYNLIILKNTLFVVRVFQFL